MKVSTAKFPEVLIIEPDIHLDNRGYFMELYRKDIFESQGIDIDFKQDNYSFSKKKNTIRGMHYQLNPKAQNKLIRVMSGEIINVVVDIRIDSPTYKQFDKIQFLAGDHKHLLVPVGFANGYCTLKDKTEIIYKVDQYYSPDHERAFVWNDPEIGIDWSIDDPILSESDKNAPNFNEVENNFKYEK